MKPTKEQIDAEILWLETNKPRIRRKTSFGDDNHAAIDAQIVILRERKSEDEVYAEAEEYGWDNRELENAADAARWMGGEEDLKPSGDNNWGGLVK